MRYLNLIRIKDWLDKLVFFLIGFLIIFLSPQAKPQIYEAFAIILIFIFSVQAGYLLNSYYEQDIDKLAKKDRGLNDSPLLLIRFLIILFVLLSVYFSLTLHLNIFFVNILLLILIFFYSWPKVYLKDKGWWGIVVPAFLQGPSQFLLLLFLNSFFLYDIILISLWLLVVNIYMQVLHQLLDYNNDIKTNVKTWAVVVGLKKAEFLVKFLFFILLFFLMMPFYILNNMYLSLVLAILIVLFYTTIARAYLKNFY